MLWAEIFRGRNALISYSGNNLTTPCSLMLVVLGSGLEYYENSGAEFLDWMEMLRTEISRCTDAIISYEGNNLTTPMVRAGLSGNAACCGDTWLRTWAQVDGCRCSGQRSSEVGMH